MLSVRWGGRGVSLDLYGEGGGGVDFLAGGGGGVVG